VRVCTIADSAAFPEVVTPEQQSEWEREERESDDGEGEEEAGETGRAQD